MDTIAEFLTRIRNAGLAKHEKLDVASSNMRVGLAKILQETGYIRTFKVARDGKQGIMRVYLKYAENGRPVISAIKKLSRPGRRLYVKSTDIPLVRSGCTRRPVATMWRYLSLGVPMTVAATIVLLSIWSTK